MNSIASSTASLDTEPVPANVLQEILQALNGLRYGQITVIVQDGRVMQIDRTERHRFPQEKSS